MSDFLRFVDDLRHRIALHVEITYSKTCDWVIYVYRKGCADEYPNGAPTHDDDAVMCYVSDPDMELCFAMAHVKPFRVYKTENDAFAIPEGIRIMISTEYCEENEEMYGCFADDGWLYWVSNYMAFGYPAFTANDEIRARAVKLHAAGII